MNKSLYLVYRLYVFLIFILSMNPWFTLNTKSIYFYILGFPLSIVAISSNICQIKARARLIIFISFVFFLWQGKISNIFGRIEYIIEWLIFVSVLTLKNELKSDIISFITKWFSALLLLSLLFYFLHLFGISLPSSWISTEKHRYALTNYYFFVCFEGSIRFQSIFLEPGHLTMGLAPLLYINGYNIKKVSVLVLIVAQLFSFSLAGYVVLVFGLLYSFIFRVGTKRFRHLIVILSFFPIFLYSSTAVFQEDVFNALIIERLKWDGNSIVGDDRSSSYLDSQFEKYKHSGIQLLTGIGYEKDKSEKGVAGFKYYMVVYGIIGIVLLLYVYSYILMRMNRVSKSSLGLLILLLLLLYQNAYPVWWCMLIVLTCGNSRMGALELESAKCSKSSI